MDKIIWILEEQRDKMLDLQRKINAYGGMRAMCMLNSKALENTITERIDKGNSMRSNPSLILLDYEMPICDGKQTLEMIRSEREFADIPVIFLTGKQDRESIMQVMGLGPAGYLLKTMKPEEVKKYVDRFFAKRRADQRMS